MLLSDTYLMDLLMMISKIKMHFIIIKNDFPGSTEQI